VSITENELKELMFNQMMRTRNEVANFCANICDTNRGYLSLGDSIRKQFSIAPKVVDDTVVFSTTPSGANPFYEVYKASKPTFTFIKGKGNKNNSIERPILTLVRGNK